MSSEKTVSLEERFGHIEEIIEKMETGDITLDQSFELYKNGLEEIKAAKEKLMTGAQALFQKVYEQAQAAGAGPDMGNMGGAAADNNTYDGDVVDGDYREV